MFFGSLSQPERPVTPTPSFILTDTGSTLEPSLPEVGFTLARTLDKRLGNLKKTVGENHPDIIKTLESLGDACLANEDYDASFQYYTQGLESSKTAFPPNHPRCADFLCCLGNVSLKKSMHKDSRSSFEAALKEYRNSLSDLSWIAEKDGKAKDVEYEVQHKIITTLASLGSIAFVQKNYNESIKIYNDALAQAKLAAVTAATADLSNERKGPKLLKEARVCVSEMFSNIASSCAEKGDRTGAIQNYNCALALQMSELGEDHKSVACTLHNIGTMHFRSAEYQLALKSYKQVLKMRRLLFGNNDFRIAEVLVNIGTVHEKAEEVERGVAALNAAIRITSKHYGGDSVACAKIHTQLGSLYARSNCNDLAIGQYNIALEAYRKSGMDENDIAIKSINDSIRFVEQSKNNEESLDGFLSATEAWSKIFGGGCGSICLPNKNEKVWDTIDMQIAPPLSSNSSLVSV